VSLSRLQQLEGDMQVLYPRRNVTKVKLKLDVISDDVLPSNETPPASAADRSDGMSANH